MKTLSNTDVKGAHAQVPDLEIWGDGDMFKLLCKASSEQEGWMKSTKAMAVQGLGVVVQVTTQQENGVSSDQAIAEAVCFVPNANIIEKTNEEGVVVGRSLEGCAPNDYEGLSAPPVSRGQVFRVKDIAGTGTSQ